MPKDGNCPIQNPTPCPAFDIISTQDLMETAHTLPNSRVVTTGGGIVVSLALLQPVIYLNSLNVGDQSNIRSVAVQGQLQMKIEDNVKIKDISVKFRGFTSTDWPGDVPANNDVINERIVFLNNGAAVLTQSDFGTKHYWQHEPIVAHSHHPRSGAAGSFLPDKLIDLFSLQAGHFYHQSKDISSYQVFPAGNYVYDFEFLIDTSIPETIDMGFGIVKYDLEATVERSRWFSPRLRGALEVPVIRTLAEDSLQSVEPILFSKKLRNRFKCDVIIAGKAFPIGSRIPIKVTLTALSSTVCQQIRVYVKEEIHHIDAKRRLGPTKFEREMLILDIIEDSDTEGSFGQKDYQDGNADSMRNLPHKIGSRATTMEFAPQLPTCLELATRGFADRIHINTTWNPIKVTHYLKIILTLTGVKDAEKPGPANFTLSHPILILSCMASRDNCSLPTYSALKSGAMPLAENIQCQCLRRSSIDEVNRSTCGASFGDFNIVEWHSLSQRKPCCSDF